jgi:hypothetical protein
VVIDPHLEHMRRQRERTLQTTVETRAETIPEDVMQGIADLVATALRQSQEIADLTTRVKTCEAALHDMVRALPSKVA